MNASRRRGGFGRKQDYTTRTAGRFALLLLIGGWQQHPTKVVVVLAAIFHTLWGISCAGEGRACAGGGVAWSKSVRI